MVSSALSPPSARLALTVFAAYVPRYDSFCDSKMECNEVYGISVNRGSSTFESGK